MFAPTVRWLRQHGPFAGHAAARRGRMRITAADLFTHLPALGDLLYLPMAPAPASTRDVAAGVLVESLLLAPLLPCCWLEAASNITVEGPLEWIDCLDHQHRVLARLHLLPDTDYLAWDALLACAGAPVVTASRHARAVRPVGAGVIRFHLRQLAGMHVLGADAAIRVSALGRRLASRIARDEAVPLQSMIRS